MTVQEFYDYCKEHGYLDYQMTTYDFDRYTEEVMFKPYNKLWHGTEVYHGRFYSRKYFLSFGNESQK